MSSGIFFANVCFARSLIKRICSVSANQVAWTWGLWVCCLKQGLGDSGSELYDIEISISMYSGDNCLAQYLQVSFKYQFTWWSLKKQVCPLILCREFSHRSCDGRRSVFPSLPQLWLKCLAVFVLKLFIAKCSWVDAVLMTWCPLPVSLYKYRESLLVFEKAGFLDFLKDHLEGSVLPPVGQGHHLQGTVVSFFSPPTPFTF